MAAEFLLDFDLVLLTRCSDRPPFPASLLAPPAARAQPPPRRRPLLAALGHLVCKLMHLPQLQRDLREVENELRFARNRLTHYEVLGEQLLARDARRVVEGHEQLKATLSAQIQALAAS